MCWEVGGTAESSVTAWRTSLPRLRCDLVSGSSFKLPSQVGDSPREPEEYIYRSDRLMDNVHWTIDWLNSHRRLIVITRHYLSDANLKQSWILTQIFFHSGAGEYAKSTKYEIWHLLLTSSLRSAALKKFSLVFQSQNFVTSPCWHPGRPHDSKTCENADETFLVWLLMPAARVWTLLGVQAGLTLHMRRVSQRCSVAISNINPLTNFLEHKYIHTQIANLHPEPEHHQSL